MKLAGILFFSIILLFSAQLAFAESGSEKSCIMFFYGNGCSHCAKAEPLIESLNEKSPELEVRKFEIYSSRENLALLHEYFDAFGVPESERGIPAVFAGQKYLIGDGPILSGLEGLLENESPKCLLPSEISQSSGSSGQSSQLDKLNSISILTIIGAALVDSINPCAIAVLLILLGALLATGDKKKALKAGLAFTLSIYIAYFLFGIGLFSALQISGLSYWFYKIVGFLAIIVGLANIKDFLWYGGGGFVMEVPRRWRPRLKGMLSKVTSPLGAFIIGFAVCLFELPCTGGPYIFILGLLAEKSTFAASIPLLLLYNVFFVLPLLIITAILYFGFFSVEKANEWKENNLRVLHLIAGIVMLALGIAVLFGII